MESKLVKLKTDFNNIINVRTTVKNIFDILQIRINKLKILYAEFIKSSKNQMFVFGLDSFNFQSKLIDIEYDDMKRLFLAINNRMYCEYFKLYKIIIDYISTNINDKKITEIVKTNNYPIYKDLEPFKEYKFEIILDIHENILNLLSVLISALNNKENELLLHKNKQSIGLNIDNFITTFNYNIIVMREKIVMFITYIEFFHKLHTKYLKRFANKIQLMYSHINNDIQFDENVEINKKTLDDSDSSNYENENNRLSVRKDSKESKESITSQEYDNNSVPSNSTLINNIDEIDLSIFQPSNDNISDRSKNSIISNISGGCTPRFKLKNVVKTMNNMLVLSNNAQEEHTQIEGSLSHDDITDMFSTIDMSCDSIINNTKKEIDTIGSQENCEQTENIITNMVEPPNYNIIDLSTNIIETNNDVLVSETMMPPAENITMLSEENNDEISLSVSESSLLTTDEQDQPKKKRAYKPRKKKEPL
jgi:hypothetical protein